MQKFGGSKSAVSVGTNDMDHFDWKKRLKQHLIRTFYENRATLSHAFQCYDDEGTGYVSLVNFEHAMKALLSVQTSIKVPDAEISDLAAKLIQESNDDRGIDYKMFIERFTKQHIKN